MGSGCETLTGSLHVNASRPAAAAAAGYASTLIQGQFTLTSAVTDAATHSVVHALDCPDCAFGPLSQLELRVPGTCQALHIVGFAVGGRGTFSAVSLPATAGGPQPEPTGTDTASGSGVPGLNLNSSHQQLASVTAKFETMLEVAQNAPGADSVRGYTLAVGPVAVVTAAAAADVIPISLSLGVAPTYVRMRVVSVTTVAQLISSLVGLYSLFTLMSLVFSQLERAVGLQRRSGSGGWSPSSGSRSGAMPASASAPDTEWIVADYLGKPGARPPSRQQAAVKVVDRRFTGVQPLPVARTAAGGALLQPEVSTVAATVIGRAERVALAAHDNAADVVHHPLTSRRQADALQDGAVSRSTITGQHTVDMPMLLTGDAQAPT
jgi:hypothetical protein